MPVYQTQQTEADIDLDELIAGLSPDRSSRAEETQGISLGERLGAVRYQWPVFTGVALASALVGAVVGFNTPTRYASHARFVGESARANVVPIRADHPLAALLTEHPHTAAVEAAGLQEEALVREVRRKLGAAPRLQPQLTVQPDLDQNVVDITATGTDPSLVSRLPGLLMETYLQQSRDREVHEARNAEALLKKEQAQAAVALQQAEHQLLAFKNHTGIQDGDEIWKIRSAQLADKEAQYAPGPEIRRLRAGLDDIAEAELELTRLNSIRHDAAVRQDRVDSLLRDLELHEAAIRPVGRILTVADRAVDLRPQDRLTVFGFTAFIGLLLAGSCALVCAQKDDRLHSLRQDWRSAGLPILAQIPFLAALRRTGRLGTWQPHLDAYRTLRTSLRIASEERPLRSLLIASAVPGEGRTTTALYMARALTLVHKRVVVIDANPSRPGLAVRCGLPRQPGLTELLQGVASVDDVVHPTQIPGLWIVPSGTVPAPGMELLSSRAFEETLDALKSQVDLIIVDSPPALMTADSQTLATKVDGVLLVVEMSRTRRRELQETRAVLENVGTRIVGIVINKVRKRHGTLVQFGRYR